MAKVKTAKEFADRLIERGKAASPQYQAGIEGVDVAPGAKAAEAADKWHARVSEASTRDKWRANVGSISLEQWKSKTLAKGVMRHGEGLEASRDKIEAFAEQLIPYQERLKSDIDKMPSLTLEQNIARMTAQVRGMAKFRFKK